MIRNFRNYAIQLRKDGRYAARVTAQGHTHCFYGKTKKEVQQKFEVFIDELMLPVNLINLTSSIASLKTMAGVRKQEYAKIFTELEAVAKVQSVKSSNAIEGIVTSDERIAAIVNQDSAPLNHTEGEIAGCRDALNAIHLNHDKPVVFLFENGEVFRTDCYSFQCPKDNRGCFP